MNRVLEDSATSGRYAALVVGMDSHGLAVARALATEMVPVYSIEWNLQLPGLKSRYVRDNFHVADFSEPALLQALLDARQRLSGYEEVVLFPMNDRHVGIIARNMERLSGLYKISWSDSADTVLLLQRKDSLEEFSRSVGLKYPRSWVVHSLADLDGVRDFRFPVILKPVHPLSSFKTFIAQSIGAAREFLAGRMDDFPVLCQEFIEGGDEALVFGELLLDKGQSVFGMTGRKLVSQPPAQGQASAAETHTDHEVLALTKQFFSTTNLSGPAALELKRAPDGQYWVIEPTIGRTEFLVELCIAAGFNQPWMEFRLALGLPMPSDISVREVVWFDAERDPLVYLKQSLSAGSLRPGGKRPAFPYWGHADLAPWLSAMSRLATSRLIAAFKAFTRKLRLAR